MRALLLIHEFKDECKKTLYADNFFKYIKITLYLLNQVFLVSYYIKYLQFENIKALFDYFTASIYMNQVQCNKYGKNSNK